MRKDTGKLLLGAALTFLMGVPDASANGRFPAAGQLVVDPSDGSHIVVRTTYGLITTRDRGETWDWICETGVGYSATTPVDPAMAMTKDGTVLAAFPGALSVAHGDNCDWTFADPLEGQTVVDVSTEKADPSRAVVIVSNAQGGGVFQTRLFESADNAATWAQAGTDLPGDLEAETLDVAPSDTERVYVSGVRGGTAGVLVRTADRGQIWESLDITWPEQDGNTGSSDVDHVPFIAGVDPLDEEVVYVRLSGTPGRLLKTSDGGETWSLAFKGQGSLKGFALSPDGTQILVGGDGDGTWRGSTSSLDFEQVSTVRPQCLTWVEAGVYACALEYNDGFTVGLSTDDGATWEAVNYLACVRGPLACSDGSTVKEECEDAWAATAELIDAESCVAGGDDDDTTATPTPEANPTPPDGDDETPGGGDGNDASGGCGCVTSDRSKGSMGGIALILSSIGLWARRRRARR